MGMGNKATRYCGSWCKSQGFIIQIASGQICFSSWSRDFFIYSHPYKISFGNKQNKTKKAKAANYIKFLSCQNEGYLVGFLQQGQGIRSRWEK